jgi:hypothetical protein
MPPELTPAGQRAQGILTYAYEDLEKNLQPARKRIANLLRSVPEGTRGRNEVGDVATQLSRLASGPGTMPSDSITAQAEGT